MHADPGAPMAKPLQALAPYVSSSCSPSPAPTREKPLSLRAGPRRPLPFGTCRTRGSQACGPGAASGRSLPPLPARPPSPLTCSPRGRWPRFAALSSTGAGRGAGGIWGRVSRAGVGAAASVGGRASDDVVGSLRLPTCRLPAIRPRRSSPPVPPPALPSFPPSPSPTPPSLPPSLSVLCPPPPHSPQPSGIPPPSSPPSPDQFVQG